jgi:hypothetical protein
MCELDGLSVQEAAQTAGISKNALKSRVLRARLKLGELLRDGNGIRPSSDDAPVIDQEDVDRHKHHDAKLQVECEQRCYPPHIPESALHPYPQGYAA